MRFFKDLPIRNKLMLSFLVLIILPVIMIGIFSFYTSKSLLKQKTEQYATDILMETGENINVKLNEIERLSFQIVSSMPIQQALKKSNRGVQDEYEKIDIEKTIDTQLKGFLSPDLDIANIQVISLTGTVYYVNPASVNIHVADGDKRLLEYGSGSAVWFGTDPATRTIAVGRVINSIVNQEMIGYVFIFIKENSIYNIYKKTELFKNGDFLITDLGGRIISCKDKAKLGSSIADVADGITPDSLKNSFITARVNGIMNYVASRTINNGNWKITAVIPTEQYEEDIINLRNWTFTICAACCFVALLISLRLSDSISMPLRNLSAMMGKVGKGDFSVSIPTDSRDEVGILSNHFNNMVVQVQKLIQEVYQEQFLKQKAELKSLRMQINPHFLYNTLESINWMARIKHVPEIGEMVKALGDLMRVSISGEDFVTLKEEIDNISNYLVIQKFRYGDRFEAFIDIGDDIKQAMVPKLILQPIVENAIIHGLEEKIGSGRIDIAGSMANSRIVIAIRDDGVGMSEDMVAWLNRRFTESANEPDGSGRNAVRIVDPRKDAESIRDMHTHIGLINVDRRIKLYYGRNYGISIESTRGGGTLVKVVLPAEQPAAG